MIIDFKKPDIKNESQERVIKRRPGRLARWKDNDGDYIDRQGQKITDERITKEIDRIISIPYNERKPIDNIRLAGFRKRGNNARNKNKLTTTEKKPPQRPNLAELNKANADNTPDKIKLVINDIYVGKNPIQAIKDNNVSPRYFFNELEKEQNISLKNEYLMARECYAEFLLYHRQQLEEQLIAGEIDSSTYSAIASDIKFLSSKLFPKMYGDKVTLETEVKHNVSLSVNNDKVLQLNELLNKPKLLDQKITDAEFEEVKD